VPTALAAGLATAYVAAKAPATALQLLPAEAATASRPSVAAAVTTEASPIVYISQANCIYRRLGVLSVFFFYGIYSSIHNCVKKFPPEEDNSMAPTILCMTKCNSS
jgi:hypothetical protein